MAIKNIIHQKINTGIESMTLASLAFSTLSLSVIGLEPNAILISLS
jgi:hypothetical protein